MNEQNLIQLQAWTEDASFLEWCQNKGPGYSKWEAWLDDYPEKRELAEIASQILTGIPFQPVNISEQKSRQALAMALNRLESPQNKPIKTIPRPQRQQRFPYQIAATLAMLLCLGGVLYYQLIWKGTSIEIKTGFGETMSLVLPDESEVVLNANSRLTYKRDQPRKVWLEGEAFFHVAKKPQSGERFQVLTQDLTVEVLGTSFNVNSHRAQTNVFLEEGKVKLNLDHEEEKELEMLPGDLLSYSGAEKKILEKSKAAPQQVTSWRTGSLRFEKTTLIEVITKMEEIYGVSIGLQNEAMNDRLMTMTIPIENLQIALATIESALGLDIQQVNPNTYELE